MLLTPVVVTHPLRNADHGSVVRRHPVLVRKVVCPRNTGHRTTRPLAVVGDEKQRYGRHCGARLNEPFDTSTSLDEALQVVRDCTARRACWRY